MKSRLIKLLSLMLVLASLLSVFSVFAFASNESAAVISEEPEGGDVTEEEESEVTVIYNRNYEEGWGMDNGLSAGNQWTEICKGNSFTVDYEIGKDQRYNYFCRLENTSVKDGHPQLNFDEVVDSLVIEFDVKVDDFCNTGLIYVCTQGSGTDRTSINLLYIKNNKLTYTDGAGSFDIGNEWVHLAYVFDFTNEEDARNGKFVVRTYVDGVAQPDLNVQTKTDNTGKPYGVMLQFIRVAVDQCTVSDVGSNYCLDNLRIYSGSTEVLEELPADQGCGNKVNKDMATTVPILGDSTGADSVMGAINAGLALKNGVEYCLLHGEKKAILTDENGEACGTPVKYGDNTLIPLQLVLDCIGYPSYVRPDGISIDISTGDSATYITLDRDNATVGGKRVELSLAPLKYTDKNGNQYVAIAVEDIETLFPGWYVTVDSTGLIFVTQKENVVNSDDSLGVIMGVAQRFVFDFPEEEQIYEDVKEQTNNFDHPYIYGNQEKFDELKAIYESKPGDENYNPDLKNWISTYIGYANNYYEYWATPKIVGEEEVFVYDQYRRPVYVQETDENGDPVFNEDGSPKYVQETDENGDPKFDQYGSPVYVQKTEIKYTYDYSEYLDENGTNLVAGRREDRKPVHPYQSSGGYDPAGGRMEEAGYTNDKIQNMAFAYQITRDVKYAKLAYQLCLDMGQWMHWAPGHFLNCSQATMPMAQTYDWLYDIWVELGYIRPATPDEKDPDGTIDLVADIIYNFGVYEGLASTQSVITPASEIRRQLGFGSMSLEWRTTTSNRNAVCAAGMITGALALMAYETTDSYHFSYGGKEYGPAYLVEDNVAGLCNYGLFQYAPDGSYIESPGYWGYGTNHLCYSLIALYTSAGTDYGILNGVGMDKTFYFAAHAESSDFRYHNYHDSDPDHAVDSKNFYFAAWALEDPSLAVIRSTQLKNGKGASLTDIFYYPEDLENGDADIPLDYYAKGVDLYCARSSWDKGAVYASMIGGANNVSHGQIDAGSFVYHNAGQIWIHDIGKDNYNVPKLGDPSYRYRYYRYKPEGNNTVTVTSRAQYLPFGQDLNGVAYATDYYTNEYGSYVTYNMAGVFGGYVNEARRGMMLTNDRKTTIVQDEIGFKSVETIYWFGHYSTRYVNKGVTLSPDKRTAYMESNVGGQNAIVRISIVSALNYTFEIMDTYTMVHDGWGKDLNGEDVYVPEADTFDRDEQNQTGTPNGELDRGLPGEEKSGKEVYYKLAIKGHGVAFELAVVMELITETDYMNADPDDLGYEWTPMSEWMPGPDTRGQGDDDGVEIRELKRADFQPIVQDMIIGYTPEDHIRYLFGDFYRRLTDLQYIYERYDGIATSYRSAYKSFVEYKTAYNAHVGEINSRSAVKNEIAKKLVGISV